MKTNKKEYEAVFYTHDDDLATIIIPALNIGRAKSLARSLKKVMKAMTILPIGTKTIVKRKNY